MNNQANSRTHQEIVAASKVNVPTVPLTQLPPTGVGYTPSLGYLGGDYTGLPKNDNLDLSPRVGFSFDAFCNGRFILCRGFCLLLAHTLTHLPPYIYSHDNTLGFSLPHH